MCKCSYGIIGPRGYIRVPRISLVLMSEYCLKTLTIYIHMMVYMKLRASVLYGRLVCFRELIKKYDKTKMDLDKLKLSM